MSTTPKRQAVVVGAFLSVGGAILAGAILTIGDLRDTFAPKVEVSAVFDGVSGLQPGNNVWFSGVKVGTVRALRLREGGRVEVDLRLDRAATPFLHADALARVGTDSLIGNKIVVLSAGSPDAPPIEAGAVLGVSDTVSAEDLLVMAQENNANLLAITTDLRAITAALAAGEGAAGRLLTDEALSARVDAAVTRIDAAAANAEALTASLATFSGRLNQPGRLPNDLVTDTRIYGDLAAGVRRLDEATRSLDGLIDGLQAAADDPSSPAGTLLRDPAVGRDLQSTVRHLDESAQLLAEDLEALQGNVLLRGYFRKKERAERRAAERDDP